MTCSDESVFVMLEVCAGSSLLGQWYLSKLHRLSTGHAVCHVLLRVDGLKDYQTLTPQKISSIRTGGY